MLKRKVQSIILACVIFMTLIVPCKIVNADFGSFVESDGYYGEVLKLVYTNDGNSGNHYVYQTFSNLSYTFQAGDYIEYDVMIENRLHGNGGLDIGTTDGQYFMDTAWYDQNGISGHPASNLSPIAFKNWIHRKLAVPNSKIGKVSSKWDLVGECDNAKLSFAAYYDNIVVTDGNGTTKAVIFKNSSGMTQNINDSVNLVSSYQMVTTTLNNYTSEMGDAIKLFVTNDGSIGNHYVYMRFSDTAYTFQAGDFLEYDVKLDNCLAGSGGIELYTSDGSWFKAAEVSDQNGIRSHPANDISGYAYMNWYHRKFAIPSSYVGKTLSRSYVAGENDTPDISYSAWYDNIVVTNGNGEIKKIIYKDSADANQNINDGSSMVSYQLMTSVSPMNRILSNMVWTGSGSNPDYTVDGDLSDAWFSTTSPNSAAYPLGNGMRIKRWVVWNASSGGDDPGYNTRDYKLQISDDNINWTDVDTVTGNTAAITDRSVDVQAKYARVYITQGTQTGYDGYVRIREIQLFGTKDNPISLYKPATASSFYPGTGEPRSAVDGRIDAAGGMWFTTAASPNWLKVDLGERCKISRWVVKNSSISDPAYPIYNTRDYKLQVSDDGVNFTDVDTVTGNTANVTDREINTTGRYVRLYVTQGTQPGSDGYIRIRELEIYGVPSASNVPVSLGKTAEASSNDSGKEAGKAVDNDITTQWRSSGTGTQWIKIDLGSMHVINGWAVKHAGANWDSTVNNTKDFKFQISSDGTNYTDVSTITNNVESVTDVNLTTHPTGRYVRLYITAGTQGGGDNKARINEFKVYGMPILKAPNPRVVTTTYATDDVVIASYDVTESPYNADKTGVNDSTLAIQKAMDDCYATGGGVVFLPSGTYKITDTLSIPNHVTLRGDWQDPDTGTAYGTVLKAYVASSELELPGLIRVNGSSALMGVTIYYPNQSASNPVPYPYTIEAPGSAYAISGYSHPNIINVTLLNSYNGISIFKSRYGLTSTGECYYLKKIRGTALKKALRVFDSADVGRGIDIKFINSYWAGAPAGYNPPDRSTIDNYTRANGTGCELGDTDLSTFYNMTFYDYKVGMHLTSGARAMFSGALFGIDIQNCNIALKTDVMQSYNGAKISNSTFKANQGTNPVAVQINSNNAEPIYFNKCTIGGGAAKAVEMSYNAQVNFEKCTFDNWSGTYAITASNGSLMVEGCTFTPGLSTTKQGISLSGSVKSAALLGNTINGNSAYFLTNTSTGDVKRQDTGYSLEDHGVTGHTFKTALPKPPNSNFFNAKASYGAKGDGMTDDTSAIQNALNAAGAAGGGTVFLPSGQYKVKTHLTVPANVELRGCDQVSHMAENGLLGTTLCIYEGHNTSSPDTDTAFITLNGTNAGINGVNIYYPNQPARMITPYIPYPWSIRGNASGVYATNITFVNAYKGIDFGYGTNQCNNHYIGNIYGTCIKNAIAVGNSTEGWMEDTLFNGTCWLRAGYPGIATWYNECYYLLYNYMQYNQINFWIGKVDNEHMLHNFAYTGQYGFYFAAQNNSGANATLINCTSDNGTCGFKFTTTGANGVKVINTDTANGWTDNAYPDIEINGGIVKLFNLTAGFTTPKGIKITGGTSLLQGVRIKNAQSEITGGTTIWNGVYMSYPGGSGAQLTISAGVTGSSFTGCMGQDSVNIVNNAGAGAVLSNNIKY